MNIIEKTCWKYLHGLEEHRHSRVLFWGRHPRLRHLRHKFSVLDGRKYERLLDCRVSRDTLLAAGYEAVRLAGGTILMLTQHPNMREQCNEYQDIEHGKEGIKK